MDYNSGASEIKLLEQEEAIFKLAISNSSSFDCKLAKSIDFASNNLSTPAAFFTSDAKELY